MYLFEILKTSLTVKNSENMVKSGSFKKPSPWRTQFFFEKKKGK